MLFMHPDAERISSYLDGELGPAERAEVEKLLVEDRSARELFAELRQLQTGVRGLPQQKLPQGFADEVMRAAERLMLLGPGESESTTAAAIEAAEWSAPAPRAAARNLWSSPAWFVSGAAAAVLLMLALGFMRSGDDPQVVEAEANQNEAVVQTEEEVDTLEHSVAPTVADAQDASADPAPKPEIEPAPAARVADTDVPPRAEPTPNMVPEVAPAAVPVRQVPPYGWVVWVNVQKKTLLDGHFDSLVASQGVIVSNTVDPATVEQGAEDVVYFEATPEQLSAVFMAMLDTKNEQLYRSPLMQQSLGVFREPAMWSEILDSVNPVVDGSRAVHITPAVIPARPLALDEANAETVKQREEELVPELQGMFPEMPPADHKPTVDDGLVRAVFILHPLPEDDAPAPKP